MQLTPFQRAFLRRYLWLRGKPPTLALLCRPYRRPWALFFAIAVLGALLAAAAPAPAHLGGVLIVGLALGAVLRDIGHNRAAIRVWPVVEEIVDWQRAEQLASEDQQPGD